MADATNDRKWAQMGAGEKLLWCGKFLVAVCTFGFAFPHIMEPHLKS